MVMKVVPKADSLAVPVDVRRHGAGDKVVDAVGDEAASVPDEAGQTLARQMRVARRVMRDNDAVLRELAR